MPAPYPRTVDGGPRAHLSVDFGTTTIRGPGGSRRKLKDRGLGDRRRRESPERRRPRSYASTFPNKAAGASCAGIMGKARPAPCIVGMRFIGRQLRRFRYVAALAAFACLLGAWPAAVSRDSQLPAPQPPPVTTASKTDFISPERREEFRVLDANGGIYQDSQLQALVSGIVERLAAS